jgi:uncharacterized membrane protein (DUF485 family)
VPVFTNITFTIPEALSKILICLLLTDVYDSQKIHGQERLEI